ncbi:hypothetical protein CDAR_226591 [Caerostris darwini]|uniref:Uncharacterized protein n=1 Tax=Caerostris darwini TaxID=1538125 RepID=A0AAV4TPK3_9ARAC|nr:hypothetical protein CDAR_226591 [Caerostris darwini]
MPLDRELTTHIGSKQGKPQELGCECDIFLSTKKSRSGNDRNSRGLNINKNKNSEEIKPRFQNSWYNKMAPNVFLSDLNSSKCVLCKGHSGPDLEEKRP